jgi:SAM-dependent methyltransferase
MGGLQSARRSLRRGYRCGNVATMRDYWDARADEDAFYFVDNRLTYGHPDHGAFWADGPRLLDEILGRLGVRIDPGDEIVEIGCGVGRMTRPLAQRGARVQALDVSARMLELAREHNPGLDNVEWILGDGSSLAGVETASADVCFSHVVFQHIPDPEITLAYVREIGRALRPGGWAAFQISNAPEIHRPPSLPRRAVAGLRSLAGRAPRGQTHPAWRGSAIDLDRLRDVADGAGLDVERIVGKGTQFCFPLLRARSQNPSR